MSLGMYVLQNQVCKQEITQISSFYFQHVVFLVHDGVNRVLVPCLVNLTGLLDSVGYTESLSKRRS